MKPFFTVFLLSVLSLRAAAPDLRYEQKIGSQLPLAASFTDETGKSAPLGAYLGQKPAVLILGYFDCPRLCSVVAQNVVDSLIEVRANAGEAYQVIYLSIDPRETPGQARARRESDLRRYGRKGPGSGWHYLTGSDAEIARVAAAAGFHYAFDPASRQYAHPAGFMVVTPAGVVSRYFLGIDYEARDLAAALRRAGRGETGESVFDLVLICIRGDGITGRYGRAIWYALQGGSLLGALTLGGAIGWMLRQERRKGGAR